MSDVRPHHGRAVGGAVGIIGIIAIVMRLAPPATRTLIRRTLTAVVVFELAMVAAVAVWFVLGSGSLSEDAMGAIGVGAIAIMATVSIVTASVVRRTVTRHVRWGYGPDGALVVWDGQGNVVYPVDEDDQPERTST